MLFFIQLMHFCNFYDLNDFSINATNEFYDLNDFSINAFLHFFATNGFYELNDFSINAFLHLRIKFMFFNF